MTGRPSKVTDEMHKQLQDDVSRDPHQYGYNQDSWDGKLLQRHLKHCNDVILSVRQCQRLLHKLQHR